MQTVLRGISKVEHGQVNVLAQPELHPLEAVPRFGGHLRVRRGVQHHAQTVPDKRVMPDPFEGEDRRQRRLGSQAACDLAHFFECLAQPLVGFVVLRPVEAQHGGGQGLADLVVELERDAAPPGCRVSAGPPPA